MSLQLSVVRDDVASQVADVLLLKHAQEFYGADEAIVARLSVFGACHEDELRIAEGDFRLVHSGGAVAPKQILFLGTPPLNKFRYAEMRQFARRAIETLSQE